MSTSCTHLDQIRVTETDVDVCPACVEAGDEWVQLRLCLYCGAVACCDDSPNRHASAHHHESRHAIVESLEPSEDWRYCYIDEILVRQPLGRLGTAGNSDD